MISVEDDDGRVSPDPSRVITDDGDRWSCMSGPDTILACYAVGGKLSVLLVTVKSVNGSSCETHVNTVWYV